MMNEKCLSSDEDVSFLIESFEDFGLCFRMNEQEGNLYKEDGIIFPDLRPIGDLFLLPISSNELSNKKCYYLGKQVRVDDGEVIPPNMFLNLQVIFLHFKYQFKISSITHSNKNRSIFIHIFIQSIICSQME